MVRSYHAHPNQAEELKEKAPVLHDGQEKVIEAGEIVRKPDLLKSGGIKNEGIEKVREGKKKKKKRSTRGI